MFSWCTKPNCYSVCTDNLYHFKNYTEVTAFSGFIEQMGNMIKKTPLSSISVHMHPSAGYYPASMQMDAYELMYID